MSENFELKARESVWQAWTAGVLSKRDALHELLIGDACALFRTNGNVSILDPMMDAMKVTVGFVNTQHVLSWVSEFMGVIVLLKKDGTTSVEKDPLSEVWADTRKALDTLKATPYWKWQTPSLVKAWKDPLEQTVSSYAYGVLTGAVTLETIQAETGQIIHDLVNSKARDPATIRKVASKAAKAGKTITLLV